MEPVDYRDHYGRGFAGGWIKSKLYFGARGLVSVRSGEGCDHPRTTGAVDTSPKGLNGRLDVAAAM